MELGDAMYIAWKLDTADAVSAESAKSMLTEGEAANLYRLRSWVVASGRLEALLVPETSLDQVAGALWPETAEPVTSRWIEGKRKCDALARQIEKLPVALGLASTPAQWPWSSAAKAAGR